jgi:hypothetical protein
MASGITGMKPNEPQLPKSEGERKGYLYQLVNEIVTHIFKIKRGVTIQDER